MTFSKEIEIAQMCLEGKMCDLLAIFNFRALANIMVDLKI